MEKKLKNELSKESIAKKEKEIAAHKELATQLEEVAALHLEIADNIKKDCCGTTFQLSVNAFGLLGMARESQKNMLDNII
jgi:hypothetical protein